MRLPDRTASTATNQSRADRRASGMAASANVVRDLEEYGRRVARDAAIERRRRTNFYASEAPCEIRVRISGLAGRLASLNGKYGAAGPLDASGKRRVSLEGEGGAAFTIKKENLMPDTGLTKKVSFATKNYNGTNLIMPI